MANIKISQLPAASTITAASDVLPIVHASVTEKATPNQIVNKVLEAPGAIGGTTPSTGAFSSVTTADLTTTGTVSLNSYITVNNTAAFLRNPRIWDSSQTHWYRMTPSELSLDVYTTLPALTGNDVFVFQAHTQTLTNKTISGANNTLSNIGNASLSNSSITINDTVVSLGGSITIGSGISYPSAGIPVSTGTAWGTSKTNPDGDLVGTTEIQTLTNKTLSAAILTNSPRIASPGIYAQNGVNLYGISAGNITSDVSCFLPNLTTSDTFVFALAAQTLTSKTLTSPTINSATINTSTITGGSISGITDLAVADGGTGASSAAAARVNLLPSYTSNASKVLALNSGGTDVEWIAMTGGGMTYPGAGVAISTGTAWSTSKTAPSGDFVGTSDTQTLSAKTLTSPTINGGTATNLTSLSVTSSVTFPFFNIDATAVWLRNPRIYDNSQNNWYRITPSELSTDVYVTLPALPGNDTFVFASFAQTLTNKTLTSPTINGGTITGITDLAIADGGTNASNATDAIWNLTNGLTGRAASRVLAVNSANTGLEWITAGGAGMVYPAAGIPLSTGSAWSTSLVAPSGDLVGTNGSQTLTNKIISGSNNTLSNIANASLTNSAITINGTSVSLGGSISTGWTTSGVNLNTTLNPSVNAIAVPWNSLANYYDIQGGSFYSYNSGTGGGTIGFVKNAYLNSSLSWIYRNSAAASFYYQTGGDHVFATSGTAGTAGGTVSLQNVIQVKATGQLRFQPLASNPSSPASGDLYYNSSSQNFQFYNGSGWGALGGSSSGGWTQATPITYTSGLSVQINTNIDTTGVTKYGDLRYCNFVCAPGSRALDSGSLAATYSGSIASTALIGFFANSGAGGVSIDPAGKGVSTGYDIGELSWHASDGAQYVKGAFITPTCSATPTSGIVPMDMNAWVMGTDGAARVGWQILSAGHVVINPPSVLGMGLVYNNPSAGRFMVGTTTPPTFTMMTARHRNFTDTTRWDYGPDTNHDYVVSYFNGSTLNGAYIVKTNPAAGWQVYSDERVKTIKRNITDAVSKVQTLRCCIGTMDAQPDVDLPFLIAQDVQSVLPEAVNEDKDGMLLMSYQSVIPLLVAAIKELSSKVEALESANNG